MRKNVDPGSTKKDTKNPPPIIFETFSRGTIRKGLRSWIIGPSGMILPMNINTRSDDSIFPLGIA